MPSTGMTSSTLPDPLQARGKRHAGAGRNIANVGRVVPVGQDGHGAPCLLTLSGHADQASGEQRVSDQFTGKCAWNQRSAAPYQV